MTKEKKEELLYEMLIIREFEKKVSECKEEKLIYGGAHCYNGEEAIAVGICSALNKSDYIVSNHRPHGHAIAKGMDPKIIMAEMLGKTTGSSSGKGGSMHLQDQSVGLIASSGIVGSGIPIGCGAAFAAKYSNDGKIACVFFGDGAANEGILHESLNIASIWKLPIIFVLEDNSFAITTNTRDTSACNDYVKLASAYGIEGQHINGQDVEEVYRTASYVSDMVRVESRPFFIQAHTIRFSEHAEGAFYRRMIEKKYRDYSILEKDIEERCPIKMYCDKLKKDKTLSDFEVDSLITKAKKIVIEAMEFAIASPDPTVDVAASNVFVEGK